MNKIIIFGFFGSGNIGNDSTLEAALHNIQEHRPNANIVCVCNGPSEVSRRFGVRAVPMTEHEAKGVASGSLPSRIRRLWLRLTDEVVFWLHRPGWFRQGDKFIVLGGGAADDHGVRQPWHQPYVLYKWCAAAKMGGAQVVFMSVGAGPIANRVSKFLLLRALRMADYRSYREVAAINYLQSIGYDTSGDFLYPDLVFSLPKASLPIPKKSLATPVVVGLGMINYYGWQYRPGTGERIYQEYLSKMKRFVSWLLDKGFTVRFLSGDIADTWPIQDLTRFVLEEGESHWQERLIVEEIADVNELLNQIAQTDLVVASRFHNVVCALMLARPVISIGYAAKNEDLLDEMGQTGYSQHIESFSVDRLQEQFLTLAANHAAASQVIADTTRRYRHRLDQQYDTLFTDQAQHASRLVASSNQR